MPKPIAKTLTLAAAVLVLAAPPAGASAGDVIRDCSEDGALDKRYSQRELSRALDTLPSDLDEYTDCRSVIRRAQLSSAHGGRAKQVEAALAGGGTPPTRGEQRTIDEAADEAASVDIGGRTIRPGATGAPFDAAGLGTDLPPFVLAALIATAAAMLWGAAFAARRRWPAAVGNPIRGLGDRVRRGVARLRR